MTSWTDSGPLGSSVPVCSSNDNISHQAVLLSFASSGSHRESASFHVISSPSAPVVLGHPRLRQHDPQIDRATGKVTGWSSGCHAARLRSALVPPSSCEVSKPEAIDRSKGLDCHLRCWRLLLLLRCVFPVDPQPFESEQVPDQHLVEIKNTKQRWLLALTANLTPGNAIIFSANSPHSHHVISCGMWLLYRADPFL